MIGLLENLQRNIIYHTKLSGSSVEKLHITVTYTCCCRKNKSLFITLLALIINKREEGTFFNLVMVVISDISEQFLIRNTSKEVKVMAELSEMLQKLYCINHQYNNTLCVCVYIKWELQHNWSIPINQQMHIETNLSLTAILIKAKCSMLLWRIVVQILWNTLENNYLEIIKELHFCI
jgi:hypothetical protein